MLLYKNIQVLFGENLKSKNISVMVRLFLVFDLGVIAGAVLQYDTESEDIPNKREGVWVSKT